MIAPTDDAAIVPVAVPTGTLPTGTLPTESHVIDENGDVILTPDHEDLGCNDEFCVPQNAYFNETEATRWADETVQEAEERIALEQASRRGKKPVSKYYHNSN